VERRSSKRGEVPAYLLKELAESGGAATLSGAAAAQRTDASSSATAQEIIDGYIPRGAPAGLIRNFSQVAGETAHPQKIQFKFQGEPCPTCLGKGGKFWSMCSDLKFWSMCSFPQISTWLHLHGTCIWSDWSQHFSVTFLAGIKPVPPPKPPTQTFEVNKPSSAGRTISSPRALKKARTLHHAARGGMLRVGRTVRVFGGA